ncbi:MAG TPA: carboxypeptidase-like regulatory domain-containing protein, partial [Wenzhouxiangella sp.]|nr:carboxypeptidase-like regulatory domain-containing protein [Wenzhouxiangella sp.]
IDCDTGDYLVFHDDGSIENGYTGNASVVSEVAIVEYFEPATYPAMIGEVCISFITTGPSRDIDFELVVFADDGPGGAPGTELGAVSATAVGIPGGGLPSAVPWFTVDVSSLNVELSSGGLYFGARYVPVDPGVFISSDESSGTTKQLGWFQTDGGAWEQIGQGGTFDDYKAMFIRPQLMPATGCVNPVDVPWLSVSPASGVTAPGASTDIDVTVDTTGLLPDTYEAEVCVLTDDSRTPIIGVPVTLTVEAPANYGTLTGNVESLGYCSTNPEPAAGATVEVVGQSSTFTTTTDANGDYTLVFDSAESPVDVTASYTGHFDGVQTGLVISAGDTTTANFSLELDAACATATPSPMAETLEPGQTSTQTLTIANDGAGELTWMLDEAEPLAEPMRFVGGIEGNAGPGVAAADPASARDMRSLFEGPLPSIEGYVGITAIDCDTAPGLVIHDDGSIENGYSGNAASVNEVAIVEYFEPVAYPASLGEVCISFITTNANDVDLTFELVVFADDGTGGAPGTELGAVTATATGIPGGGLPATVPWFTADLSGLNLAIQSGGVYIGARYAPVDPGIFIASDETASNPQQTGYFQTDGGAWTELSDPAMFPDYRAMFIRPQMFAAGCAAPSDVPWLSLTPTSGTTPAGGTSDVDVTADATGLTNGTYEALLCLHSDDPQQPLIEIPYRLDVSQDLIFQDRFEQ